VAAFGGESRGLNESSWAKLLKFGLGLS